MSVDDVLNYKRSADEDFYAILNCDENSAVSFLNNNLNLKNRV